MFSAGDNDNFLNATADEQFNGVGNHGFVVDGEKVFVGDFCEWKKPRAKSSCENNAFHGVW